ncbi:MAG: hypothetical protein JST10_13950 [Bacteroidetes bacterium]|nr:hypothetical protein [Bacteroidota bacterium]MBS1633665.1 hypothetical protein [Bacteroidota bacterium]
MILRLLLYAFLIYLLYKIVFNFIIPVYKTSRQIKKGFRDVHQRMSEQMNSKKQYPASPEPKAANPKSKAEDYIDFEEIK